MYKESINQKLLLLTLLSLSVVNHTDAKSPKWLKVRIKKAITMDCSIPDLPTDHRMKLLIKRVQRHSENTVSNWGDKGIIYDLNADGHPEILAPIACAGAGNCEWAIFQTKPRFKFLGSIFGQIMYLQSATAQWSPIIMFVHFSVSDGVLTRYSFHKGKYVTRNKDYYVSAYKHNEPRFMYPTATNCK